MEARDRGRDGKRDARREGGCTLQSLSSVMGLCAFVSHTFTYSPSLPTNSQKDGDFVEASDPWSPIVYLILHGYGQATGLVNKALKEWHGTKLDGGELDLEIRLLDTDAPTGLMAGFTALHIAMVYSSPKMTKFLLRRGANPLRNDNALGVTSAHCAVVRYGPACCASQADFGALYM